MLVRKPIAIRSDGTLILAYCATGAGGGVDPSCGRDSSSPGRRDGSSNALSPKASIQAVAGALHERGVQMLPLSEAPAWKPGDKETSYAVRDKKTGEEFNITTTKIREFLKSSSKDISEYGTSKKQDAVFKLAKKGSQIARQVMLSFCPTGQGGGVDPTCGKDGNGLNSVSGVSIKKDKFDVIHEQALDQRKMSGFAASGYSARAARGSKEANAVRMQALVNDPKKYHETRALLDAKASYYHALAAKAHISAGGTSVKTIEKHVAYAKFHAMKAQEHSDTAKNITYGS